MANFTMHLNRFTVAFENTAAFREKLGLLVFLMDIPNYNIDLPFEVRELDPEEDVIKTKEGQFFSKQLAFLHELQSAAPWAHEEETPGNTPDELLEKRIMLTATPDGRPALDIFIPFTAAGRADTLEADIVDAINIGFNVLNTKHLSQTEYETFDPAKMESL